MHRGCTSDWHRHQGAWLLYAHDAGQLSVGSAGKRGCMCRRFTDIIWDVLHILLPKSGERAGEYKPSLRGAAAQRGRLRRPFFASSHPPALLELLCLFVRLLYLPARPPGVVLDLGLVCAECR